MKRKARELLALVEDMCVYDNEEVYERLVFQRSKNGDLIITELDQEIAPIAENGNKVIVAESLGEESKSNHLENIIQSSQQFSQYEIPIHYPEDEIFNQLQNGAHDLGNDVEEYDDDVIDLNSSYFNPKNWPADASTRCHIYSRFNNNFTAAEQQSSILPRNETHIVYLSITTHRIEGNAALAMALWLSDSLAIELDVVTFIEESIYATAFAEEDCVEHCAHRKAITRLTSLSSFKSRLSEGLGLDLHVFQLMKNELLSQVLLNHYSSSNCSRCSRISGAPCPTPVNLIILADDGLHPYLDSLLSSFDPQNFSTFQIQRNCESCNESLAPAAVIQFVMTFDSSSIVPCRQLISECLDHATSSSTSTTSSSSTLSPNSDIHIVKELLGRLNSKFESHSFSTQNLLSPVGPSLEIQLKWMRNRSHLSSTRRYFNSERDINWVAVGNAISQYNNKFLSSSSPDFETLCCNRLAVLDVVSQLLELPPTPSPKILKSNFWDIYSCWGVISPLEIPYQCFQNSKLSIWRVQFRSHLLHLESCRLVFLFKSQSSLSSPVNRGVSYSIRVQQLLSPKSLQLLKLCAGPPSSQLMRPGNILQPDSGDDLFNKIHSRLKRSGVIPFGSCGAYWICFLLLHCVSGEAAIQIATLEMAKNSLLFVEYTSWPLAYIASLLESISTTVIGELQWEGQIYQSLEYFLDRIRPLCNE